MGTWREIVDGIGERTEFGNARLVRDPRRKGGWTLLFEEVQQSYVDVADPTHLSFEYARRIAAVVDTMAPAGRRCGSCTSAVAPSRCRGTSPRPGPAPRR
ncbi:hypothetical protein [Dactylosporangium cerinum]